MEEHQGLETLEVIKRIDDAIIKLGLGHQHRLTWSPSDSLGNSAYQVARLIE